MKRLTLIVVASVATCLFSCRTQKAMTTTDRDSSLSYADTTKTVADTIGHKQTYTDTTNTSAAYEGVGIIEFVEVGGKVNIDNSGNITFEGVKNIKGEHKGTITQNKGIAHEVEEAAGHNEQLSGVKADQARREKRTEEKTPAQKWYETTFIRIGQGVCFAALIWLIYLYVYRKH